LYFIYVFIDNSLAVCCKFSPKLKTQAGAADDLGNFIVLGSS